MVSMVTRVVKWLTCKRHDPQRGCRWLGEVWTGRTQYPQIQQRKTNRLHTCLCSHKAVVGAIRAGEHFVVGVRGVHAFRLRHSIIHLSGTTFHIRNRGLQKSPAALLTRIANWCSYIFRYNSSIPYYFQIQEYWPFQVEFNVSMHQTKPKSSIEPNHA